MRIPTITEQDSAIAEIKQLCTILAEMTRALPGHPLHSGLKSADMLLSEYGQPFYMDADSSKVRRMTPQQCFANAFRMATRNPELTYVEGKCHIGVLPIDHAWVITQDGRVIDPTLQRRSKSAKVTPCGYFGIPFRTEYIEKVAYRSGYFGILNGMTNPQIIEGKDKPEEFLARIASDETGHTELPAVEVH